MTRKMKDSGIEWIGEIPEDWEVIKVKHEYDFSTGFTPETNRTEYYDDENGYEWVNISDLDGSKFLSKQTKNKISKTYINLYKPKSVPQGSLMYSFKLSVGQRTFNVRETYTNEAIASFMNNKNIDLNYFYYSSSLIAYNSNKNIYGARILNQELIKNAPVPFPSLEEQYKISTFLDKKTKQIEDIKNTISEEIENLEDYKKSVITEAVTKGLDKNVEMKDSGIEWIGEIPKHWKINKIGRICNVITDFVASGSFASIAKNVTYLDKEDYAMLVRTVDLSNKRENVNRIYINKSSYEFLRNSNLIGGEIVLPNIGASIGDVYIVPELYKRMSLAPNSIMIKTKYVDKYYYYCFISKYGKILLQNLSISSAQPKFNKTELRNIKMMQPPKEEQEQIVRYLDKKTKLIDDSIAIKQKQLETLEEYKKSLIYEYVTGKKEVKDGEES